jgi:hypothetical protein
MQDVGSILSAAGAVAPFIPGGALIAPYLEAGGAAIGSIVQNQAAKALQANQGNALSQAESLAQQEAQGPYLQSLIDAEGSGVKTLESNIGGIANPGSVIKDILGNNITSAIRASLQQRNANLQGASETLLGAGSQYGGLASGAARAAAGGGSPFSSAASAILAGRLGHNAGGSTVNTGTVTGAGSSGAPSWSEGGSY